MPLSWNEIKARASKFSNDWEKAHYEKGETQTFYNEFFEVFGIRRRNVAVYEEKVKKLNNKYGFIDLFWPGQLLIEQKSAGRSLEKAKEQATDYFISITEKEKPRFILLSDFQNFELLDLESGSKTSFKLSTLKDNVEIFYFIAGYQEESYRDQDPANIKASALMGGLHNELKSRGYKGADLEKFLVRIMFCLFAEDTGIFEKESFLRLIEDRTNQDGSDLGPILIFLFQILNTPSEQRQDDLDEIYSMFPYVNGELFSEQLSIPSFSSATREALLTCSYFDWTKVSPALFGSLFQTVMMPEEQRKNGAHYTSEKNILKVIKSLFLDDLYTEYKKLSNDKSTKRITRLNQFHTHISSLKFLDPACGCGNFLILCYRELRELEILILNEIYPDEQRQLIMDISSLNIVNVDHFYGIEIDEFACRIAETAMWLVDHQMNIKLSELFGKAFVRLPLTNSAHIFNKNALKVDWKTILDSEKCNYILGNPPFLGKKEQSKSQKEELNTVFSGVKSKGILDYVSCWFYLAAKYAKDSSISIGLVSTKSVVQGEQVGILWKEIYDLGFSINFAHRVFKWTIDEKKTPGMKVASVHVVIIGFSKDKNCDKYIFDYPSTTSDPHKIKVNKINSYLVDAPEVVIRTRRNPISDFSPKMSYGSIAIDNGYLILSEEKKNELEKIEPLLKPFLKPYVGSTELISGDYRYCIWLKDASPKQINSFSVLKSYIEEVKKYRESSGRQATKDLAKVPYLFGEIRQPNSDYILIPKVSSESRRYIPIAFCSKDTIANGSSLIISEPSLYVFGIVSSEMHMAWMRYVGGRTKSDYQYSSSLVFNNFPWPKPISNKITSIENAAKSVLDARARYKDSNLSDLYNSGSAPSDLIKAHEDLDRKVDNLFTRKSFVDDADRIIFLFNEYNKI